MYLKKLFSIVKKGLGKDKSPLVEEGVMVVPFEETGKKVCPLLMLGSVRQKLAAALTPKQFVDVLKSEDVCRRVAEYREGNAKAKQQLPTFLFQGVPTQQSRDAAVERSQKLHKTLAYDRKSEMLEARGLFMMDFDHCNVEETAEKFLAAAEQLEISMVDDVALMHATPSGKGLRVVMRIFDGAGGGSIEGCQAVVAQTMGVDYDGVCKDLSRLSFACAWADIIYYNAAVLFSFPKPIVKSKPSTVNSQQSTVNGQQSTINSQESTVKSQNSRLMPIIAAWLAGSNNPLVVNGIPKEGCRNSVLYQLAFDLKHLVNGDEQKVREALWTHAREWGLEPDEITSTIRSACKDGVNMHMSNDMKRVVATVEGNGASTDMASSLPALPEKMPHILETMTSIMMDYQRPAACIMIFPWLLTYLKNLLVLMPDGTDGELGLITTCVGESGCGKGGIEHLFKRLCQDMIIDANEGSAMFNDWKQDSNAKKSKLPKIYIPILNANITSAAMREILAIHDHLGNMSAAMVHAPEIDSLRAICNDGNKSNASEFFRHLFDRSTIGAFRFGKDSSSHQAPARLNISACGTPASVQKFFGKSSSLTDGTAGRVAFCIMPTVDVENFGYGRYSPQQMEEIKYYKDNLKNFKPQRDSLGSIIPIEVPEALQMYREVETEIRDHSDEYGDRVYAPFARRTNNMVFRMAVVLYIANGCHWDATFSDFYRWACSYLMQCKMSLFGKEAEKHTEAEQLSIVSSKPLILDLMTQVFTLKDVCDACVKYHAKMSANRLIDKWKERGKIEQDENEYTFRKVIHSPLLRCDIATE